MAPSKLYEFYLAGHIHGVSGGLYTVLGALVLFDKVLNHAAVLGGSPSSPLLPDWMAFVASRSKCFDLGSNLQLR